VVILVDISKLNYFENKSFLFVLKNGVIGDGDYLLCEEYIGFFMKSLFSGDLLEICD
jgi:hypothetical protein